MTDTLLRTPLHDRHVALGARMMSFAGFDMPVQYSGIIDEHLAVRQAAGLFDVSHMGEFRVRGPHAFDLLQHVATNDLGRLYDGRALYTVMCYEDGGIVDDMIVYRLGEEDYLVVVNAANIQKDFDWIVSNNPMKAEVEDVSSDYALLALQGPAAFDIVEAATGLSVADTKFYHFFQPEPGVFLGCQHALVSHTGYTGEAGLEIYCEPARAPVVWDALLEAGASRGLVPAGLGARDTLRLESGYCLYGNDITAETHPLEAGLGWVTKLDKGDFVGREALAEIKAAGLKRRLVAFVLEERGIPRPGYSLVDEAGAEIGTVTSGTQSPVLSCGIGMGYVAFDRREPGTRLGVRIRNRTIPAVVTKPPLHKAVAT